MRAHRVAVLAAGCALSASLASMTAVQTAQARAAEPLLLLHFGGDLTGAGGEVPTQATGVAFDEGVAGRVWSSMTAMCSPTRPRR